MIFLILKKLIVGGMLVGYLVARRQEQRRISSVGFDAWKAARQEERA